MKTLNYGILSLFVLLALAVTTPVAAQPPTTASGFTIVNDDGEEVTLNIPASGVTDYTLFFPKDAPTPGSLFYGTNTGGNTEWLAPGTPGQVLTVGAAGTFLWTNPNASAWSLLGNAGTNPVLNFLGTTDTQPLVLRTDNVERVRITETGNVGIGTDAPTALLEIESDATSALARPRILLDNTSGSNNNSYIHFEGDLDNNRSFTILQWSAGQNLAIETKNDVDGSTTLAQFQKGGDLVLPNGGIFTDGKATIGDLTGADAPTDLIVTADATTGELKTGPSVSGLDATDDIWVNNPAGNRVEVGTDSDGTTARPAGTEVVVTDGGHIGMGTVTPATKIELDYPTETNPGIRVTGAVDVGGILELLDVDGAGVMLSGDNGGAQFGLGLTSMGDNLVLRVGDANDHMEFITGGVNQRMVIQDPTGHIGIGTGNITSDPPTNRLHVRDAANPIRLEGLQAGVNTDEILTADANGVVRKIAISSLPTGGGWWDTTTGSGTPATGLRTVTSGAVNSATGVYSMAGGQSNIASGDWSTVSGGSDNDATKISSTVAGGENNKATGDYVTIGGGEGNEASGGNATIAGGSTNIASGGTSTIGGGTTNTASGSNATISGGDNNAASGVMSTIGGGQHGEATAWTSTVGGGFKNIASDTAATVAGGWLNEASGDVSSIGGGFENAATAQYATVGGGTHNEATGKKATIGGGGNNAASGSEATIAGGEDNIASAQISTVGGGDENQATEYAATVAGGENNVASGYASVISGGEDNIAQKNYSTIGGGWQNETSGQSATIAGGRANDVNSDYATVGGGVGNAATASGATVAGGGTSTANGNTASGQTSFIGGGFSNAASGNSAVIAGGARGKAAGSKSVVGGGEENEANMSQSTVAGGFRNKVNGIKGTIGGGTVNTVTGGSNVTIGGGQNNEAEGNSTVIAGGAINKITGNYSAISGGRGLTLSGAGSFGFLGNNSSGTKDMTIAASNTTTFGNTDLWLANNDGAASALHFFEANSTTGAFPGTTNSSSFKAGTQTADIDYTLPTAKPAVGQVMQATTVVGTNVTLEWTGGRGRIDATTGGDVDPAVGTQYGLTISDAAVTATSMIVVTYENPNAAGGGIVSWVQKRTAGTSFVVRMAATPPAGTFINYYILP